MKTAAKLAAFGLAAAGLSGCTYAGYDQVYNDEEHRGIQVEDLDNTPGTISSAVIFAPARYKKGVDTIAEVSAGSVRACFTQVVDAAVTNSGRYRVDCLDTNGIISARFECKSGTERVTTKEAVSGDLFREAERGIWEYTPYVDCHRLEF